MKPEVTYVFENGKTYAMAEGRVVAASTDLDEVERHVKEAYGEATEMPPPPPDLGMETTQGMPGPTGAPGPGGLPCPNCQGPLDPQNGSCLECGYQDPQTNPWTGHEPNDFGPMDSDVYDEPVRPMARTVTTPNGLKGTVLGKVASTWGDEVTIRLENGRIVHLPAGTKLSFEKTASTEKTNPIKQLERKLAADVDGTQESLLTRREDLIRIRKSAMTLIREGVSHDDALRLDEIVVTADAEGQEVEDAIEHLADEELQGYSPPARFEVGVAPVTESMGGNDSGWLNQAYDSLQADVEATDYGKLMDEGPEAFAAELPDAAIADSGATSDMATEFVSSKTAGTNPEIRNDYIKAFVARVEECRKEELSTRKEPTTKEAAVQEEDYSDLPDDVLFT